MLMGIEMAAAAAEDPPARPRRIYHASWKFRIGQAVDAFGCDAIILSRQRTALGRELYSLWIASLACGRPYRIFHKDMLIPKI